MDSQANLTIHFPGKLVFGNDSILGIPDELIELSSSRVLIITIEPLLARIEKLIQKMKRLNIAVFVITDVINEPSFSDFEKIMYTASEINPDTVLGIGGGSVLDIAKLVSAQHNNTQLITDIVGNGLLRGRYTKLICVPATSGTGS